MTAERGFALGTLTDAGVISTSSTVPSKPSAPLRTNLNDAALTDGPLSSRSNATAIDVGRSASVELGSGDTDVTRIGARLAAAGCAPSPIHCRITLMSLCG